MVIVKAEADQLFRVSAGASERHQAGVDLMLRQLLLVMIECACQPHEVVSRLGCACIRYRPQPVFLFAYNIFD